MAGIEAFFEEQDDDEVIDITPPTGDTEEEVPTDEEDVEEESIDEETEEETEEEVSEDQPEEVVVEKETEESEEDSPEEPVEVQASGNELKETISSLRQMLREQAQEIKILKGQSKMVTEKLTEVGHIDESDLESAQEEDEGEVSPERTESLSVLAEAMRVSGKYEDFDEVCSQDNFDEVVEVLAKVAMQEDGGTLTENMENVQSYIWGLANPYRFVYDILKEHHPKYAATEEEEPVKTSGKEVKKAPKAPKSVGAIPGGSGGRNEGWTAAKIDALDEADLHTVPTDVYEKYMRNELN